MLKPLGFLKYPLAESGRVRPPAHDVDLVVGALIGIIPESGPHLIVVMMHAEGLVSFSVLFTTSFVQDGHGMLPLLSDSIKDSLLIKVFNLTFGLIVSGGLYLLGL
jgi:hypothetical protein